MVKLNIPSPFQQLTSQFLTHFNVSLYIKRDDLIDPDISGNKWRKLVGHLIKFQESGKKSIISFGGAYSNHLHALAAVCKHHNIPVKAIVRGEESALKNSTLSACQTLGMTFSFVDRLTYKKRNDVDYLACLQQQNSTAYIIKEGGFGVEITNGLTALANEIDQQIASLTNPHHYFICCPMGSGATAAGLCKTTQQPIIGFPAIKNGAYLQQDVNALLKHEATNLTLHCQYHFGGFGKLSPELLAFIHDFYSTYQIALDPIYTSKAMYGLFELIKTGAIASGSHIVFIHTGGLQGWKGMQERGLVDDDFIQTLQLESSSH